MPARKKPVDVVDETVAIEKPKRTRRKVVEAPEPAAPPVETVATQERPKPRRSRKTAEPEPKPTPTPEPVAEAPKPRRTRKAQEPRPEPVVEATAPVEAPSEQPTRARRSRRTAAPTPETEPEPEAPARRPRRRPKAEPAPDTPVEAAPEPETEAPSTELAPRRTRNRRRREVREREITAAAALQTAEPEPEQARDLQSEDDDDFDEAGPRRRRRGRRGRRKKGGPMDLVSGDGQVEIPAEAPAPSRKVEEPLAPVGRLGIAIPEDAPQVVVQNGVPTLVRGKRVLPPLFFFGAALDERRAENVLQQVRLAADAGVHVFGHLIDLMVDPASVNDAVAFAGYLLKKTVEIDPDAQVFFRVVFAAPRGWQDRYKKAAYVAESGGLAEPSVCDDEFWGQAEACLDRFIRTLRMLDLKDHILGVHLERGEWFFAEGWGYDVSIAAHEKFRDWLRTRYRDDVVALRAAWFDGQVQFQTLSVPEFDPDVRAGEEFVRTGRKARRWVDYHLFLSDVTVERIAKLAYAAKKASEGYFLVGASYGYTFEWSHPASGHLSLGKLLRTPEIDFIAGPPSYKSREPGGVAPFPGPIDSFALNGKLYVSEEDFKTPISGVQEPDDFNPVMKTPQALESVHWRGAGAALAHSSGVCWMDLWGNGWLDTPGIWERGAKLADTLIRRMGAPVVDPEVAVFIDERSLAYLVDQKAFSLLVQNVRDSVLRSGMSAGFYLLSDLAHREKFPESKLYVFMNAWDIRPEVRGAIKNRLQRDGKVLFWLYAAGLFEGGRDSLERVREVTGIALKPQPFAMKPGTAIRQRRHPLCEPLPEKMMALGGALEPSYFAIPEDGGVLGEYAQSGLPSYVLREFQTEGSPSLHWKSVFLGEPVVTPGLFRALGQLAGAHVWNYHEDLTHIRPPFLTVHCSGAGSRTIALPDRWAAYDVTHPHWSVTEATHLRFNATDGSTHTYLVGPQSEIESLLARDPSELMELAEIPERPENTLHPDALTFDVQIMKLDEWMEDAWSEDLAEDLLLKPSMLDVDAGLPPVTIAESTNAGRDRKRRSRRQRGSKPKPDGAPSEQGNGAGFDDLGMNVLFRKRE